MAFLQVKNRAVSTLASGISDSDLSLTVAAGEGAKFPQPGNGFHITIEDEILKCTARSGDTLTVTRAQEGTGAAAHSAGKAVELRITAKLISDLNAAEVGDLKPPTKALDMNSQNVTGVASLTATELHGTTYWGDVHLEDVECPACHRKFKTEDRLVFIVSKVEERFITAIPVHLTCDGGQ